MEMEDQFVDIDTESPVKWAAPKKPTTSTKAQQIN